MTHVEVWHADGYELAEGARRVGDRLIFVDILTGRLLECPAQRSGTARVLARLDVPLGAVAPVADEPDTWIAAAGTGIGLIGPDGRLRWIDRPEDGGRVATRMNDGCCDAAGRFWAGSMAYDNTPGAGSLYRVDADGSVTRVVDGFTIVNGPAFAQTGERMYVADSAAGRIHRYAIGPTGEVTETEVFVQVPPGEGSPDGMTVDDTGRLWVALWGASQVRCYDLDGSLRFTLALPCSQPSSVCLGTADEGRLFVTTARLGLRTAAREDGAILAATVNASAPPARPWLGIG